jgi:hypothetical protein
MMPVLVTVLALVAARSDGGATVRLDVRPMPAPTPAMKYQLLPEVRELQAGNPAQWYVRCFMEQRNFFFGKQGTEERDRYRAMPLSELKKLDLRGYGRHALTQADWGARLDTPDWQVLDRVQTEGTDVVMPDLAPLRILGTSLHVRFRFELAARDFDAAVGTAKTIFALSRHLGEHPTTTANLLGLSIADMALDALEEMVQQPGCPNLYWALTDVPCPLVDLRKGFQGDRATIDSELRQLRGTPMTDSQIDGVVSRLSGRAGFARERAGLPPRNLRTKLAAQAKDKDRVTSIQLRLVASGDWNAAAMPPLQLILLDEKRAFEARRDEELKLLALTPAQTDALLDRLPASSDNGLFADLLPHVREARRTQARTEQRVALLRHVEALRLYAAAHDGKLPEKLTDIDVPLPPDPFTGKPFAYKLDGGTAHLRGGTPKGEEKNPAFGRSYEITVAK